MKTSGAILSVKIGSKVYIHSKRNGSPILYDSVPACSEAILYLYAAAHGDRGAMVALAMADFRVHLVEIPCYVTSGTPAPIRLIGSLYGFLCTDPKASEWHARGGVPAERKTPRATRRVVSRA